LQFFDECAVPVSFRGLTPKLRYKIYCFLEGILYFRDFDDYRTTKINEPIFDLLQLAGSLGHKKSGTSTLFVESSVWVARAGLAKLIQGELILNKTFFALRKMIFCFLAAP